MFNRPKEITIVFANENQDRDMHYHTWLSLKCMLNHEYNGYCSVSNMLRHVGFSYSTIRKHMRELCESGYVEDGEKSIPRLTPKASSIDILRVGIEYVKDDFTKNKTRFIETILQTTPEYEVPLTSWLMKNQNKIRNK